MKEPLKQLLVRRADDRQLTQELERMLAEGKGPVLVSLERYQPKHTQAQLGYYWAGVVASAVAHWEGWTPYEVHEHLKSLFFRRLSWNPITKEFVWITDHVGRARKMEMIDYIDACVMYLASEGCIVETPDEYWERLEREATDGNGAEADPGGARGAQDPQEEVRGVHFQPSPDSAALRAHRARPSESKAAKQRNARKAP